MRDKVRNSSRVFVLLCLILGTAVNAFAQMGSTISVNTTADGPSCSTICTLRGALALADQTPGLDTINFDSGAIGTITVLSPLEPIRFPVRIDATSVPGYAGTPRVVVDGSNNTLTDGTSGFEFAVGSDGSTITGLAIVNFTGAGILVNGPSNITIRGNYIGTDGAGALSLGNRTGIAVSGNSNNVLIGGLTDDARNVIVGSTSAGISVANTNATSIFNNAIGIGPDGATPNPNTFGITAVNTANLSIGSTTGNSGNVISGNLDTGISIQGSIPDDGPAVVQANFIGVSEDGSTVIPNNRGILLSGSTGDSIGGSSNGGNLISGNTGSAIEIENSTNVLVGGNIIGTDSGGTRALPNALGIGVRESSGVTIGGDPSNGDGVTNLISGNVLGVSVSCSSARSAANTIQGNIIGTSQDGQTSLANTNGGILIENCGGNIIGGDRTKGNLVSGDSGSNRSLIEIRNASSTRVARNMIGVNPTGERSVGSGGIGLLLKGATDTVIGEQNAGNVIGGRDIGVLVTGGDAAGQSAGRNTIEFNHIGANQTGTGAVANNIGILVTSSGFTSVENSVQDTAIGAASRGNLISGNAAAGVAIRGAQVTSVSINGNKIGTDITGTAGISNGGDGILNSSSSATVQAGTPAAPNIIAFNLGNGISVEAGKISARANSIFSNSSLGIDLKIGDTSDADSNGVTANDMLDSDTGGNDLQNFPELNVTRTKDGVLLAGRLVSLPSSAYTLDFFRNSIADDTGYGEGSTFLESLNINTNASGVAEFNQQIALASPLSDTESISATATSSDGRTSEFSISYTAQSEFNPGERITTPPAVIVQNRDVVLTLKKFRAPRNRALLTPDLDAARRKGAKGTIEYEVTVKNSGTSRVTKKKSRRNVVTLKNLPPGTYSASYKVRLKRDNKVVAQSKKSPNAGFTVR